MKLNQIESGTKIGGFQLEKELGRGGMGVVFKAHELSLNRKVALKILSERLSEDDEFIKRFQREAKVVAALSHPNIVNILSYGEENGLYYFAMEYVQGTDLGIILKERNMMPLSEALPIALQIADALEEAAAKGVVHRDLKPSNIMIDSVGRIKITDYGIAYFQDADARLTHTGLYMGTPEYSSPEQASGQKLDIRSDIYSLGAVLYKMLSGEPPVTGESPLAVVAKIMTEPIRPIAKVNPSLPKPVCDLIDKMTAKELDKRFQTPREVTDAIASCMTKLHIEAPVTGRVPSAVAGAPPPPLPGIQHKPKKMKTYAAAAGIILAILLSIWTVDALFLKEKPEEKVEQPATSEPAVQTQPPAQEAAVPPPSAQKQPVTSRQETMAKKEEPAPPPAPPARVEKPAAMQVEKPVAAREEPRQEEPVSPYRETAPEKAAKLKEKPVTTAKIDKTPAVALPRIPVVLTIVSGDETMAPVVQTHIESVLADSGLQVTSVAEIPVLMEKMQMGSLPVSWYDIKRLIPNEQANIILISQIQQTGTMPLQFYGRTQTLTTVSFTVRAVDMETGATAGKSASGTAKFTPLNMDEELRKAVTKTVEGMGQTIKQYWQQKLQGAEPKG
ncbi:MAG: protein kinase [Deltaproteobacteria bacterium]|nr:protein kinase [Deltaproteobacteria bacterium]